METTVRDFILDNLTDQHFEKLVNRLIIENVRLYDLDDRTETVSQYLKEQKPSYTKNDSFEIVNEIERMNNPQMMDLKELNDLIPVWMPTRNNVEEHPDKGINTDEELDVSDSPNGRDPLNGSEYSSFRQLKIAFLSENPLEREKNDIAPYEVNSTNYKAYVRQEINRVAWGLSNFIYEMLHYSPANKPEEFPDEKSLVKIRDDEDQQDGYCVHFLLDNRTRYISEEAHQAYLRRWDSAIPIVEPGFMDYFSIWEDYITDKTYILAPFTNYLNEKMIVPELSEEGLMDVLVQLVHFLTLNGFTKEEQIEEIICANSNYDHIFM
ncbi:hypothetical protein [Virgibacillus senegalensis]|uniref:hypothetical protein n=1 Tax=Virgibacillus senegalensis TaxID=1499679 RepID=UPI00069E4FC1|nr:hypothetical protein [Virgibacillus senegalensis]